jgi:hypothetical protein
VTKKNTSPKQAVTLDVAAMKGSLKPIGGSQSDDWNDVICFAGKQFDLEKREPRDR